MFLGGAFAFSTDVEAQTTTTIEGTYYGRTVRNGDMQMPCAGVSRRICAKVKIVTTNVTNLGSVVKYECTRTLFDENDAVLGTTDEEYIVPVDVPLEIYLEEDALSKNLQYATDLVRNDNYATPVY